MRYFSTILLLSLILGLLANRSENRHTPQGNLDTEKTGRFCHIDCHKLPGFAASDRFTFSRINIPLSETEYNDVCQGIGKGCPCAQGKQFFQDFLGKMQYEEHINAMVKECSQRKFNDKPKAAKVVEPADCKNGVCCRETKVCKADGKCTVTGIKCDSPKVKKTKKVEKVVTKKVRGGKKRKMTRVCITLDGTTTVKSNIVGLVNGLAKAGKKRFSKEVKRSNKGTRKGSKKSCWKEIEEINIFVMNE